MYLDPVNEAQARLIAARVADLLRETGVVTPEYLTPRQASQFLSIPERTLEDMRRRAPDGIPFVRVNQLVRYRVTDIINWMEARRWTGPGPGKRGGGHE